MNLSIEFRDDVLWVTVTGTAILAEAMRVYTAACDAALEHRTDWILLDVSAVEGDLSYMDRYELGRTMADYFLNKSQTFVVATVGKRPLVEGFGAMVARSRGAIAETFSDTTRAADWLNRFGRSPKIQR